MGDRHEFAIYDWGLVNASVCAERSLPLDEITERLNRELPTGVPSRWSPSDRKMFSGGEPQPGPCNQWPDTHVHYLFHC